MEDTGLGRKEIWEEGYLPGGLSTRLYIMTKRKLRTNTKHYRRSLKWRRSRYDYLGSNTNLHDYFIKGETNFEIFNSLANEVKNSSGDAVEKVDDYGERNESNENEVEENVETHVVENEAGALKDGHIPFLNITIRRGRSSKP